MSAKNARFNTIASAFAASGIDVNDTRSEAALSHAPRREQVVRAVWCRCVKGQVAPHVADNIRKWHVEAAARAQNQNRRAS